MKLIFPDIEVPLEFKTTLSITTKADTQIIHQRKFLTKYVLGADIRINSLYD